MRIAQITPGIIPIPPNGWGAVEKIIWEYTKVLRNNGHEVEIIYTDEVRKGEWDVVHVHMANLALLLKERGIPYVFSHHDHHAYWLGKDSDVYKKNLEAMKGSVLSFVHAKYLVEYFESLPQLRYLAHGANIDDYKFEDRTKDLMENGPKLMIMANNGLLGNPLFDRKGFIPGIQSAKQLDLPITVICPRRGNEDFFRANPEVASYEKLKIEYDLDYETSLKRMSEHHIFLNPGILEAGHPNLTVTENIAMGIPVVGTMEEKMPGLRRVDFAGNSVDSKDLSKGIEDVIKEYSSYVLECKNQRELSSWEVVVSRMVMDYASFCGISQKKLILDGYRRIPKNNIKLDGKGYYYWFRRNPYFYKSSYPSPGSLSIIFRDVRTGSIMNAMFPGNAKRTWSMAKDPEDQYVDWEIVLKVGDEVIHTFKMDLKDQHVLIEPGKAIRPDLHYMVDDFIEATGCIATFRSGFSINGLKSKTFSFSGSDDSGFYRILNTDQIVDYFNSKSQTKDNTLIVLKPGALGDTIGFIPYANEYAKRRGIKCQVACNFDYLFDGVYDNINIIPIPNNFKEFTDIICCDYVYDLPLQLGFAKQLKMIEAGKLRPEIRKSGKDRPFRKKYVCFSTHSTAQAKHWNNNNAWEKLCDMLEKRGLVPVCVDRYESFGIDGHWNPIPTNCLNKSGMQLMDMCHWIEHCEFFVGLSSGLSWVAHALGKKVVMISGVTAVDNEFDEDCIRLHRSDVCNSCFNSPAKYPFNPGDWLWCPEHKGTSRAFECSKRISAKQVMDAIDAHGWI